MMIQLRSSQPLQGFTMPLLFFVLDFLKGVGVLFQLGKVKLDLGAAHGAIQLALDQRVLVNDGRLAASGATTT